MGFWLLWMPLLLDGPIAMGVGPFKATAALTLGRSFYDSCGRPIPFNSSDMEHNRTVNNGMAGDFGGLEGLFFVCFSRRARLVATCCRGSGGEAGRKTDKKTELGEQWVCAISYTTWYGLFLLRAMLCRPRSSVAGLHPQRMVRTCRRESTCLRRLCRTLETCSFWLGSRKSLQRQIDSRLADSFPLIFVIH